MSENPKSGGLSSTVHVRRAREGDSQSIAWMVKRFTPFIASVARRRLPLELLKRGMVSLEDVVNDTWVRFLPRLPDLQENRAGRLTPTAVAYLRNTTHNICLERAREHRKTPQQADAGDQAPDRVIVVADDAGADHRVLWGEVLQKFEQAVRALPDEYQEVLVRRIIDGLSPEDVGARLGKSANAVTIILHKARKALLESLGESFLDDLPEE